MINFKIESKIETEYDAIYENIAGILKKINEINSSIELIRYLNYLKNKLKEENQ